MAASSQSARIQLPGFGLPIEQSSEIPTATDGWRAPPITVRKRTMIALMATIKDKPDWNRKVFDEKIVAKWRSEALEFGRNMAHVQPRSQEEQDEDFDRSGSSRQNGARIEFDGSDRQKTVSERMFGYCIAELRDEATSLDEDRAYTTAIDANAAVYMSDTAVSLETKEKLKAAVAPLDDVPEPKKD